MGAKLVALVLPLGLDTFAVAAALGVAGAPPTQRLRIAILFTAFEAGMPLLGFALGAPLGRAIGSAADYVAIGVLIAFGIYTLLSSQRGEHERLDRLTRPGGVGAILLGVSISLDEPGRRLYVRPSATPRRPGDRAHRRAGVRRCPAWTTAGRTLK